MNQRGIYLFISAFLAVVFLSSLSSAYVGYGNTRFWVEQTIQAAVDIFEPVLAVLFGGTAWSGLLLFEKLLLMIILVSIIYLASKKIPMFEDQKAIRWTISIVIPLIAIRFIRYEWLEAIILQYQVIAIAITVILPFVLYFFFVYNIAGDHGVIRKIAWGLFIAIYVGLWSTAPDGDMGAVYLWTVIAGLVCLLFDTKIDRYHRYKQIIKKDSDAKHREIGRINMEIQEIERQVASHALDAGVGKKLIKDLNKFKTWLLKEI